MVTAKDIAERLNVAISTVGRAMSDDPRISGATKLRVRQAAAEMGYVGNSPARMMRGASSKMVGLMIPDVANDFYSAVAQSLSACLDREHYSLSLALTNDDSGREARLIRDLVGARAAGIIIVPTARPQPQARVLLSGIPHVQLLRRHSDLGACFGIDDGPALTAATNHLLAAGHRRIAYVGGDERLSTGAARVAGFRQAMEAAAIDPAERLEVLGSPTLAVGVAAMERLTTLPNPPTAIVTGSVHITLGVIQYVEAHGIATPDRFSLIGFGNAPWFAWWRGGLTSIQPPVKDLATNCGLWLLEQLRGPDTSGTNTMTAVLASHLLIGTSVSGPTS